MQSFTNRKCFLPHVRRYHRYFDIVSVATITNQCCYSQVEHQQLSTCAGRWRDAHVSVIDQYGLSQLISQPHFMLMHLQKLAIQTRQCSRELQGSLCITAFVPTQTTWAVPMLKAGKAYQAAVKGKPGHDLGPPHLHIAMALLEALLADREATGRAEQEGAAAQHLFLQDLHQKVLTAEGFRP